MAEGKTLGAKQVATRIGTDAKTFRKFMRAHQAGVGQGRRYDFPEADVPEIAKAFKKWFANSKAPKTPTAKAEREYSPDVKKGPARETHVVKPMTLHGSGPSLKITHDPISDDEIDDLDNELMLDELDDDEELEDLVDIEMLEEDDELDDEEDEDE